MIQRFARPYAKALLDAAGDLDSAVAVRDDLTLFSQAMAKVPRIAAVSSNPGVPADVKSRAVSQIANSLGIDEPAQKFLSLLLSNYRLAQLAEILEAVNELIERRQGVVTAAITTAQELDDGQRRRLADVLEHALGRRVDLEVSVDPTLLGGFVALVGSKRYDVSLRGQLSRMSAQLASAASRAEIR